MSERRAGIVLSVCPELQSYHSGPSVDLSLFILLCFNKDHTGVFVCFIPFTPFSFKNACAGLTFFQIVMCSEYDCAIERIVHLQIENIYFFLISPFYPCWLCWCESPSFRHISFSYVCLLLNIIEMALGNVFFSEIMTQLLKITQRPCCEQFLRVNL